MKYHDVEPISREEAERRIAGADVNAACHALVGLAFHDEDWRYLQDLCLRLLAESNPDLRGLAITCLGHVARIHGKLDLEIVEPILERLHDDPSLMGLVEDTFDDIRIYITEKDS